MNPHPRIRKTVKWGGAALTVLLVVVWIGSVGRWAQWISPSGSWMATLSRGRVSAWHATWSLPPTTGWRTGRESFGLELLPSLRDPNSLGGLTIPVWMIAGCPLVLTAYAWRLDYLARRRARVGRCPKCTYDRAGLPIEAVCPECGIPQPPTR